MWEVSVYIAGDLGSIPGSGRSPGEGNVNPLQYYCLENPMDRGAWLATVHGVAKSWTRRRDFTFTFFHVGICLQCRETQVQSWVGKIPWRREWQPTPVFLPGESHGQRSLEGYSLWGCKELDVTKVT